MNRYVVFSALVLIALIGVISKHAYVQHTNTWGGNIVGYIDPEKYGAIPYHVDPNFDDNHLAFQRILDAIHKEGLHGIITLKGMTWRLTDTVYVPKIVGLKIEGGGGQWLIHGQGSYFRHANVNVDSRGGQQGRFTWDGPKGAGTKMFESNASGVYLSNVSFVGALITGTSVNDWDVNLPDNERVDIGWHTITDEATPNLNAGKMGFSALTFSHCTRGFVAGDPDDNPAYDNRGTDTLVGQYLLIHQCGTGLKIYTLQYVDTRIDHVVLWQDDGYAIDHFVGGKLWIEGYVLLQRPDAFLRIGRTAVNANIFHLRNGTMDDIVTSDTTWSLVEMYDNAVQDGTQIVLDGGVISSTVLAGTDLVEVRGNTSVVVKNWKWWPQDSISGQQGSAAQLPTVYFYNNGLTSNSAPWTIIRNDSVNLIAYDNWDHRNQHYPDIQIDTKVYKHPYPFYFSTPYIGYHLEETSSGAVANYGTVFTGTGTSSATIQFDVDGRFGKCFNIGNAADAFIDTNFANYPTTPGHTFWCWMKRDGTISSDEFLFGNTVDGTSRGIWFGLQANGTLKLIHHNGTIATETTGVTNVCDDNWHLVGFAWSNGEGGRPDECAIFVDDAKDGPGYATATGTNFNNNGNSYRVGLNVGGTQPYGGLLDEVNCEDTHLTHELRRSLYVPPGDTGELRDIVLP